MRAQRRAQLDAKVRDAFEAERSRAGSPRLSKRLQVGRRQVAESLRCQGLRAKAARKFKATTHSNHALPVAQNLLQQDFTAQGPDQVWVGDITSIGTNAGWLYLAVVLDLYSRKVVGWSMSERMTATLVCDALRIALFRRHRPRGVIMHTDRGSQYCSRERRALLEAHGLIASMSAKGNCYGNAAMEIWNYSDKVEAIHGERFTTRAQANWSCGRSATWRISPIGCLLHTTRFVLQYRPRQVARDEIHTGYTQGYLQRSVRFRLYHHMSSPSHPGRHLHAIASGFPHRRAQHCVVR